MTVSIKAIDELKDLVVEKVHEQERKPGFVYQDLRLEIGLGKAAGSQNGNPLGAREDYGISLGVRTIAMHGKYNAFGFKGASIGEKQLKNLGKVIEECQETSFKRAKLNAMHKQKINARHASLTVYSTELAQVEPIIDKVEGSFKKNPLSIELSELIDESKKLSKEMKKIKEIKSAYVGIDAGISRKLFVSSEGSVIDQSWPLTEAFVFCTAVGKGSADYSASLGDTAGLEVLEGKNVFEKDLEEFSLFIAKGTAELSNAPPARDSGKEVNVVTDPWYNCLLVHEICGHPSEADRALKKEAAWAGRAWWFKSMTDNLLGKRVASENVSVFSDPGLKGYGNYKYDDEGVKAKKVYNIEKGILKNFLNSRETAALLGQEPNGGMRATDAEDVPLIRMNNTCFGEGDWKPEEIIKETRNGYYLVGERIPSIGDTRQNFKITCWKLFEIKNGEIGRLYRNGGITADSNKYLLSVDACANDFKLFPVPNCGKGTPMQVMKVGNGGPTMRAKARITGATR